MRAERLLLGHTGVHEPPAEPTAGANAAAAASDGRRDVEETLRKFSRIIEQTGDSVFVTDREGVIEYVNPAFEATTGYAREEAVGRTPAILKSGHHDAGFYKGMWEGLLNGRTFGELDQGGFIDALYKKK